MLRAAQNQPQYFEKGRIYLASAHPDRIPSDFAQKSIQPEAPTNAFASQAAAQ